MVALYILRVHKQKEIYTMILLKFHLIKLIKSQRYSDANKIIEQSILDKKPITNVVGHSL
jgi:hypothetical protein